jgi:molybdopterin molybdotransferase
MAAGMLSLPWIDDLGHLRDDPGAIREALQMASQEHDVVLTSVGMSHSAADHMRTALEACNARLEVLNVAMRPGKPATVGRVGRALCIGLPGNPMAAAVVLGQIGFPAIPATSGFRQHSVDWYSAVAGFDDRKREGRTEFVPVKVTGRDEMGLPVLARLGRGSSGSLLPIAVADGLAVLRPESIHIPEGTVVQYEPFGICTIRNSALACYNILKHRLIQVT